MREEIINAFPICSHNACMEVRTETEFHILDEENSKCRIIKADETDFNFTVTNPGAKQISFLAIDRCLFNDSTHKKCDFAVFDEQTFCFVEIKDTYKNRHLYKKIAIEQLRVTIEIFRQLISFRNYSVEAIISWKYRPTRPAASTQMQSAAVEFRDELGVELLEGNRKEFAEFRL